MALGLFRLMRGMIYFIDDELGLVEMEVENCLAVEDQGLVLLALYELGFSPSHDNPVLAVVDGGLV
jgi:hypothetical protein